MTDTYSTAPSDEGEWRRLLAGSTTAPAAAPQDDLLQKWKSEEPGVLGDIGTGLEKAYYQQKGILYSAYGMATGEDVSQEIVDARRRDQELLYSLETEKQKERLAQTKGFMPYVGTAFENPRGWASSVLESSGSFVAPVLGGVAGGAAGFAAGVTTGPGVAATTAAGVFGGGLIVNGGGELAEFMIEQGMDPDNPEHIQHVLTDPDLRYAAAVRAMKYGIPVSAIDAGAQYLGMRGVAKPLLKSVGLMPTVAREAGVGFVTQEAATGTGEVLGEAWSTGQVKGEQVAAEMLGDVLGNAVETGWSMLYTHPLKQAGIISDEEIDKEAEKGKRGDQGDDGPKGLRGPSRGLGEPPRPKEARPASEKPDVIYGEAPPEPPPPPGAGGVGPDEAKRAGRTKFGYQEPGGSARVYGTYEEAAAASVQGEPGGTIFAVSPRDVTSEAGKAKVQPEVAEFVSVVTENDPDAMLTVMPNLMREIEEKHGTHVAETLDAARTAYTAERSAAGPDPMARAAAATKLRAAVQAAVPLVSEAQAVYKGDVQANRVEPRTRNIGEIVTNQTSRHVDLDKLMANARAAGITPIPEQIHVKTMANRALGEPNQPDVVPDTFKFSRGMTLAEALNLSPQAWKDAWRRGEIGWKGKLDPRFVRSGLTFSKRGGIGLNAAEVRALLDGAKAEAGENVPPPHARKKGAEGYPELDIEMPPQQEWIRPRRTDTRYGFTTDPGKRKWADQDLYDAFTYGNQVVFDHELYDDITHTVSNFILHLAEKLGITTKFIVAWLDPDGKLDPLLHTIAPEYAKVIEGHFAGGKGKGAFHAFGPDAAIMVMRRQPTTAGMYQSAAHEFGHLISFDKTTRGSLWARLKLWGAYRRALGNFDLRAFMGWRNWKLRVFSPARAAELTRAKFEREKGYYLSYEEWWAEQVVRWALTDRRPMGLLGQLAKGTARDIEEALTAFAAEAGVSKRNLSAPTEVTNFLNATLAKDVDVDWHKTILEEDLEQGTRDNAYHFYDNADDIPPGPESENVRAAAAGKGPFDQHTLDRLKQMKAGVDRYNWFYKMAVNLWQLAAMNPHIPGLQRLREYLGLAKVDRDRIMVQADKLLRRWRKLANDQGLKLAGFLRDMDLMSYLSDAERATGVERWPTTEELRAMVRASGMEKEAWELYKDIRDFYGKQLDGYEELANLQAEKQDDALVQAQKKGANKAMIDQLRKRPYFPQMRFGRWVHAIYDLKGVIQYISMYETKGDRDRAAAVLMKEVDKSTGKLRFDPKQYEHRSSTLPEEIYPFAGMPASALEQLLKMPGLSTNQRDWIKDLYMAQSPAVSGIHRLQRRVGYQGYSFDAQRTFAASAFHYATFYARNKYIDRMEEQVMDIRSMRKPTGAAGFKDVSKRTEIANFAEKYLKEFKNPSEDWAIFRTITALWWLGFSPASAVVNLSQVVVMSMPYLAAKQGNAFRAMAAFSRASSSLETYYRKGTLESLADPKKNPHASAMQRAVQFAVEIGLIDESQAAELAATATGNSLQRFGSTKIGTAAQRGFLHFSEMAMLMQRMTEQWNRRVTFRAGFDDAIRHINEKKTKKHLDNLVRLNTLMYEQLIKEKKFTDQEARAFIGAMDLVKSTHFDYDRLSRPAFMRGKASVLFAFYMFTQNSLFALWHNKDMLWRYALVMGAIGGALGLVPDDIEDLLRQMAFYLGGKDFNLDREATRFIKDMWGEDPALPPDLILHGAGEYGFGLPAFMRMVGATWAPDISFSKQIPLNRIVPMSPFSLMEPNQDWNQRVEQATQSIGGAAYDIPLNLMKALMSNDLQMNDFRRWERAMPRALRAVVTAHRLASEGGERTAGDEMITPINTDDPVQTAELVAKSMGFSPKRWADEMKARNWMYESQSFWETWRGSLMQKARSARESGDEESIEEARKQIDSFNRQAPSKALRIQREDLRRSRTLRRERVKRIEHGRLPDIDKAIQTDVRELGYPSPILEQKVR